MFLGENTSEPSATICAGISGLVPSRPPRLGYLSVKPAEVIRGSWKAARLNGTAHIGGKLLEVRFLLSRDGSCGFALDVIAGATVDHREQKSRRVSRFQSSDRNSSDRNSSVTTQPIAPATG